MPRAAVLGLLAWVLMACGCALVQPDGPGSPAVATAAAGPPAFRLEVQAPEPLRALLAQHLDLARLQQLPDEDRLGGAELNRLIASVPQQARNLLQTEGYFDARVQVLPQPDADAAANTGAGQAARLVRVLVEPGPATTVTSLVVDTEGALAQRAAAGEAEALALRGALPSAATLQPGQVFRNADWSAAKQQWLTRLRSAGYAAARLSDSQAVVDAPARSAALRVRIDSGPRFVAGPLQVTGLKHHDAGMVQNLAGFGPGAPLTEGLLLAFQDRLQKTQLFASISVGFEPDPLAAAAAPVRVRLTEAPLQQATVGVGVSANTGPRMTLEHTHRRPLDWPVQVYNKLEWGRDTQSWTGDLQTHPGPGFYRNLLGVQVERVVGSNDVVLSQRLRLGRTQDTPRIERLYFLELLRSRQDDLPASGVVRLGGPGSAAAISANLHWVWRDLDSALLPTRGVSVTLQGGAGQAVQAGGPNGPFARLYGRFTGYLPLGSQWYGTARVEAGQIFRGTGVHVPDALGFRAGGDDSVRGYAYRTLAPTDANGSTISGERLLTASVEVARPIVASIPSVWGALFIDAGRAVSDWHDYSAAWGWGAGIRWRSPVGPLRVDLAWADELKKLRLHFSVGIAF